MNLQSQITEIRRRIAEPYPDDPSDAQVTDDEIIDWIWQAELRIHTDAHPSALSLATGGVVFEADFTTAGNEIALPADPDAIMLKPVAFSMKRASGAPRIPCKYVPFTDYLRAYDDPNWRTNASHPICAIMHNLLYVYPANPTGGTVYMHYVGIPNRRYRHYRGSVTSVVTNDEWADSKAVARGWPDDYFSGVGLLLSQLKYTSGEPNGRIVQVDDYIGATGTFESSEGPYPYSYDTVLVPDVNVGDTFEVGQNCNLPLIFDSPLYAYVTHLAMTKMQDDSAPKYLADYEREIAQINQTFQTPMEGVTR